MLEEEDNLWNTTKRVLTSGSEDSVTWEAFLTVFRERYFPMAVREREWSSWSLPKGTSLSPSMRLSSLSFLNSPHMVEHEATKAYKFERGLKPSIQSKLSTLMLRILL